MNTQCNSFDHNISASLNQKSSYLSSKWSLPAMVGKLHHYLETLLQRRDTRDAFKQLLELDDSLLRDIGVTRDDVKWAASLPLSVNAADALQKCANVHKQLKDLA